VINKEQRNRKLASSECHYCVLKSPFLGRDFPRFPATLHYVMEKRLQIVLAMVWDLNLSHEIGEGFFDYARTKINWNIQCMNWRQMIENLRENTWSDLDGLVIAGDSRTYQDILIDRSFSLVTTHWMPENPELYQVDIDPLGTGSLAADHLTSGGYRRLAAISCAPHHQHTARAEAFAERCRKKEFPCEMFIFPGAYAGRPPDELIEAILTWVHDGDLPAALFCTEDSLGARLTQTLIEAGLHVPDDVAILGCEDDRKTCERSFPALSSVRPPYRQVGFEAARLLDAQLSGKKVKPRQLFLPAEEITVRMSTSLFATPDTQLRRAIEFIRRHACENISVKDAARHAGITPDTLRRRFQKEVGQSPNAEIQHVRMEKVKDFLRNTGLPLDEIAEATGYPDGHYLSKAFKNKTGNTARKYRNAHRR